MIGSVVRALMAFCLMVTIAGAAGAEPGKAAPIFYRSVKVDGLSIFYREAGPANAPTLLLLHGFPSSSRMFDPLFARLADHAISSPRTIRGSGTAMRRTPRRSSIRSIISPT